MSVMTATEYAAIQPTKVATTTFLTATNLHTIPMARTCLNLSAESNGSVTLKMPSMPAISAQSVTVGNDLTAAAPTLGSKSLTKGTNRAVFTEDANTERANNNQDIVTQIIAQSAGSLLAALETALGALYTGVTHSRDAGLNDIAEADIDYISEQFDGVNAPQEGRCLVLSPTQMSAVSRLPRFSEADKIGDGSMIRLGRPAGKIKNFWVFKSNLLTSTGGQRMNMAYVAAQAAGADVEQMGYGETGIAPEGSSAQAGVTAISYSVGKIPQPYANVMSMELPFGRTTFDYRTAGAANQIRTDMLFGVLNHKPEFAGVIKTNP